MDVLIMIEVMFSNIKRNRRFLKELSDARRSVEETLLDGDRNVFDSFVDTLMSRVMKGVMSVKIDRMNQVQDRSGDFTLVRDGLTLLLCLTVPQVGVLDVTMGRQILVSVMSMLRTIMGEAEKQVDDGNLLEEFIW